MNQTSSSNLHRACYALATIGTVLTLLILATSLLLRLATQATLDGNTESVLAPAMEQASRTVHRLSASGVGVLALLALLMCFRKPGLGPGRKQAIAGVLVTTISLALIGPLTPGYRIEAITVLNVALGSLLLMALWSLREFTRATRERPKPLTRMALLTLAALVLHMGTGAGAAAKSQWVHQLGWAVWLHVASAVGFIVCMVLFMRHRRPNGGVLLVKVWRYLLMSQVLLGGLLMVLSLRPIWLNFSHGIVSALIAMVLLTLMLRQSE